MKLTDPDNEKKWREREEEEQSFLQKPIMTKILLGVIAVLLICILVLLTIVASNRKNSRDKTDQDLQQSITDYAKEQQDLEEQVLEEDEEKPAAVEPLPEETEEEEEEPEEEDELVSADNEKTAIVVDIEDENDEAYTKEYILKEAYPFFADNNQDAIWDLAHLKRYVKLSKGLEGSWEY